MPRRKPLREIWESLERTEDGAVVVPLTSGYSTLVDEDAISAIGEYSWRASEGTRGPVYARGSLALGGSSKTAMMHRLIMNAPKSKQVDHIDRIFSLEEQNRRFVLRLFNPSRNRRPSGSTGRYGVFKARSNGWRGMGFRAVISLPYRDTVEEAAKDYDLGIELLRPYIPELRFNRTNSE